jgi:hypothetical protein
MGNQKNIHLELWDSSGSPPFVAGLRKLIVPPFLGVLVYAFYFISCIILCNIYGLVGCVRTHVKPIACMVKSMRRSAQMKWFRLTSEK